jgi:3-dehydroquinate synthase
MIIPGEKVKTIQVKLSETPYEIKIANGIRKKIPVLTKKMDLGNYGIIVTSRSVAAAYKKEISSLFKLKNYHLIIVPDGEKAKTKKWLFTVINEIVKKDSWNKQLYVVCLGGGVVGDLGGFAASIYKRGVPYIQVPTTLLAQIDSSIGGKTAIDLKEAKNIIGSFYQPKAVFIDPDFLNTLPEKEIKQGIAEAIKYGVIKDRELFYLLKTNSRSVLDLEKELINNIILRCTAIKAEIITRDEKERSGLRTILNFGHTLGHAIESASQYSKMPHGYAIGIGMAYAAHLAVYLGLSHNRLSEELKEALQAYKIPTKTRIPPGELYRSLIYDKKFVAGSIRMVLAQDIGKARVIKSIKPQIIKKTLALFSKS